MACMRKKRKDITQDNSFKSEEWMSAEYDERILKIEDFQAEEIS